MDCELDTGHSEMFPYAIALAQRLGAVHIWIEPDIVLNERKHRPDVLGLRAQGSAKELIVIECEASHGKIFDEGGPVCRYSENAELRSNAEFHFILRFQAKHRRKRIQEWFGPDATIHDFDSMKTEREFELLDLLR